MRGGRCEESAARRALLVPLATRLSDKTNTSSFTTRSTRRREDLKDKLKRAEEYSKLLRSKLGER